MSALLPHRFLFRFRFRVSRQDDLPRSDEQTLLGLSAADQFADLSILDGGPGFAELRVAWNPHGIGFSLDVSGKRQPPQCHPERPTESDGLQLWIDTRDTQTIHRAGRFCHFFCFLPSGDGPDGLQPSGTQLRIPRAREDAPVCEPESLLVTSQLRPDGYSLEAWLSDGVLNGYDTQAQPRIGFNYLVKDAELGTQSLTVADDFPSASDPSLWSTLELV